MGCNAGCYCDNCGDCHCNSKCKPQRVREHQKLQKAIDERRIRGAKNAEKLKKKLIKMGIPADAIETDWKYPAVLKISCYDIEV